MLKPPCLKVDFPALIDAETMLFLVVFDLGKPGRTDPRSVIGYSRIHGLGGSLKVIPEADSLIDAVRP